MKKFPITLATVFLLMASLSSGYSQNQNDTIPVPVDLGEIVVTSLRIDRRIKDLPVSMAVVDSTQYLKRSALTLSNVLEDEPGKIRRRRSLGYQYKYTGFGEDRLVILVDGNRVGTATDLTASFSMIDVNDG